MGVPAVPIGRRVPVVVIGASLAGLAVAGRLALVGHRVVLHERRDRISALAPSVIDLPAAWRDSFRKSGRPLDLELQALGLQWRPAPPTDYGVLLLPHSRGEQWETLGTRWGEPVARRWQDFLDSTDQVWQAMRPLGIESELSDPRLDRRTRQAIGWRRSLADLAAALHHDGLAELLTAIAAEHDADPDGSPAGTPPGTASAVPSAAGSSSMPTDVPTTRHWSACCGAGWTNAGWSYDWARRSNPRRP